jgi:hypothetical protein
MSSAKSRVTSRAACRGTRTRGGGEVVDDEPGVVDDEWREEPRDEPRGVPNTRTRGVGEVVDDEPTRGGVVDDERRNEPRDKPRDVPRHPDARRRRSSR